MRRRSPRGGGSVPVLLPLLLVLVLSGCLPGLEEPADDADDPASAAPSFDPQARSTGPVLAISLDGLRSDALRRLGPVRAPHLHRLRELGSSTLDARALLESTGTLANRAGMLTGRRVDEAEGGHGVAADHEGGPDRLLGADGTPLPSLVTLLAADGRRAALVAQAGESGLVADTWPEALDSVDVVEGGAGRVMARALATAAENQRPRRAGVVLARIDALDRAGHRHGFDSWDYRDAITRVDEALAGVVDALADGTVRAVVLTSAHGGSSEGEHGDPQAAENFTVPFVLVARRVPPGEDLARLVGVTAPEGKQAAYDGPQPVRNADLGNTVAGIYGLEPIPDSEFRAVYDALTRD